MENVIKTNLTDDIYLFQIPILSDNYAYLVTWGSKCLCIDPGSAKEVSDVLDSEKLELFSILVTHYHEDHTGGIEELKESTSCQVVGPIDDRIKELDHNVAEGEELDIGSFAIDVIATPGHTKPHI
ncbi:MAG: MBL fold metallo-hydrolase, partial [Simkaniaceae bacterium]|nr:MBL fold metallo-hydrolase [Simkaniaceae bacterium]